jgi:hypothetical protein
MHGTNVVIVSIGLIVVVVVAVAVVVVVVGINSFVNQGPTFFCSCHDENDCVLLPCTLVVLSPHIGFGERPFTL